MANLHRAFAAHTPGKVAFKKIDKTATLDQPVLITLTGEGKNLEHVTLNAPITLTLTAQEDNIRHSATTDAPIILVSTAAGDVVIPGALDKPIILTSATSARHDRTATADAAINLTLTSDVRITIKGRASNTINTNNPLVLTGVGTVPNKAVVNEPITLVSTAVGTVQFARLDAPVSLELTSAATQISVMNGAATLPLLTINSELDNPLPNDLTLPALTIESTVATGTTAEMEATLPMLTIEIDLGHDTDVALPALTIDATLEPGNFVSAESVLPPLTIDAQLDSAVLINVTGDLPALISSAQLDTSGEILANANLPALQLESTASSGNVANVSILLPVLSSTGTLAENGVATLTQTLPSLYSNAQLHNGATASFNPYVMNTESYTVAQYDNYNFHSVFERAGKYYGVTTGGIYELVGSNDNGTAIAASFKLGFSDMKKPGLKRVPYVYLGYKSDGDMTVDVSIDGEPTARQYTVGNISSTSGIKRGRAKVARGLKSRYWQFGVSNVAGADFEIEELGFFVQQFDRKAQ